MIGVTIPIFSTITEKRDLRNLKRKKNTLFYNVEYFFRKYVCLLQVYLKFV